MEKLVNLKEKLTRRPVPWAKLPDLPLYKDQVVTYMQRQTIDSSGDERVTSAMISNYVKDKLLPKPSGKRYVREHVAGLTEICLLKQILSVKDAGFLLSLKNKKHGPEEFYNEFVGILDGMLNDVANGIDAHWEGEALHDMALDFAIRSYCCRLACTGLLEIIREEKNENSQSK